MKIVIDTNIIVSAALCPDGKPAKILKLAADSDEIQVYYSEEILAEYKGVLSRARLGIDVEKQLRAISLIERVGIPVEPSVSNIPLPDETDRTFYDTAKETESTLITGNTKHYPEDDFIMTPHQFLEGLTE